MPRFLTRHAENFVLTNGQIDAARSPYAEQYPNYPQRAAALARVIGTDQFLWAVEAKRGFCFYEEIKPVEWEVIMSEERVLGYVDDEKWFAFVKGQYSTTPSCFSRNRLVGTSTSVLLPFPLRREELICRRVFKVNNPHCAIVVREEPL